MHPDNDPMPEDPRERETDERIRQVLSPLSETPKPNAPPAVQARVFTRIRRRRTMVRVACAAVIMVLAGAAGLTSLWQSNRDPNTTPMVRQNDSMLESSDEAPDAWLETLGADILSAPPPVFTLDFVARDQYALLDHLKSLNGVQK